MKCVFIYLFLFFATNLLPMTNGDKNKFIEASLKARKYENKANPKELRDYVIDALGKQMKGRKFIAVSNTRYKLIKYWRGFRKNVWRLVTNVVSPSLAREARTGRAITKMMYQNHKIAKKSGNDKRPKGKNHEEPSEESDDEDDDDYDDKPSRKKNGKNKDDSDEDDDSVKDDYSDENPKQVENKKRPPKKAVPPTKAAPPVKVGK